MIELKTGGSHQHRFDAWLRRQLPSGAVMLQRLQGRPRAAHVVQVDVE